VRLCYPLNDTPLFSYPAISIRKFRWEHMPLFQRVIWQTIATIWAAFFICVFIAGSTQHQRTWADFNPMMFWRFLGCVCILALFPLIVFPVLMAFREAHPTSGPVSLFYPEWASAFAGTGKSGGGRIVFFAEDAERFRIEPSTFRDAPVKVVTVTFRRRYFFKRGDARFVIRTDEKCGLEKMVAWARDRGIDVEEIPAGVHRWS